MSSLLLYVHTLRYLRWKQVVYRFLYLLKSHRLQKSKSIALPSPPLANNKSCISSFLTAPVSYQQGTFTFLNRSHAFPNGIDWNFSGYGRLWCYNLNYFDFLNQPDMTADEGLGLLRSFLAGMESNRVGMEPYPTSLRGINWIKFLTRWGIRDEAADVGLYRQYRLLLGNLEYHLLGNHLLENGFSLLFGAWYFGDEGFFRRAEKILREELAEQILPDGGHFERSPMYHQIILGRALDCINLLTPSHSEERGDSVPRHSGLVPEPRKKVCPHSLLSLLEETAARMLDWLEQMTFRNGSIPLMNDAVFGMAPTTAELSAYAARLGVSARRVPLKESGYRKIENDVYEAVLDVGDIGPDYIPGHAHADTLNFELHVSGCPVIVDSGTSTYEDCPLRHWQRSTRAHNTVEIDGQDQSEVWGSFRVARRARVTELKEGNGFIEVAHDGYQRLPGRPMHRREWRFGERGFQIRDRITGRFQEAVGRFHFHPDVRLDAHSDACQTGTVHLSNGTLLSWQIMKGRGHFAETTYHPEFNVSISNRCLEVLFMEPETIVEFTIEIVA